MWGRLMNWMMMQLVVIIMALHTLTVVVVFLDIINKTIFFFFRQRLFTKELNLFYQSPKSDRNNLEFK